MNVKNVSITIQRKNDVLHFSAMGLIAVYCLVKKRMQSLHGERMFEKNKKILKKVLTNMYISATIIP